MYAFAGLGDSQIQPPQPASRDTVNAIMLVLGVGVVAVAGYYYYEWYSWHREV